MAGSSNMNVITITHVTTATVILNINGIRFLTDPVFCPPQEWDVSPVFAKMPKEAQLPTDSSSEKHPHIASFEGPAMQLYDLPPIDAILLSHEDHPDNLDTEGRKLLEARKVFTTPDGANQLLYRPGIVGLKPYETVDAVVGGTLFKITGTPCRHVPGGECTGFILETESFGIHSSGRPNAIWISGDTIDFDELMDIGPRWHIEVALVNLGKAMAATPIGPAQISLDAKSAIDLVRHFGAEVMVPVHMDSWDHFTEHGTDVRRIVKEQKFEDRVCFLTPGEPKVVAEF